MTAATFDQRAMQIAERGLTRRGFTGLLASALGALFLTDTPVGPSPAYAAALPNCDDLGRQVCLAACNLAYGVAVAKCAPVCLAAETPPGALACAACLGASSVAELACIHACNDSFCTCPAGSTECKPVSIAGVSLGLYLTKQCCTDGESCALTGCSGGCDTKNCIKKGFFGNCYNACNAEQKCCAGACKNVLTDVNNCSACFNKCPASAGSGACCGGQCCYTKDICRTQDHHLLVWGRCSKSGDPCAGYIDTGQPC